VSEVEKEENSTNEKKVTAQEIQSNDIGGKRPPEKSKSPK